jgi:hypothetical protein
MKNWAQLVYLAVLVGGGFMLWGRLDRIERKVEAIQGRIEAVQLECTAHRR